MLNLHDVSQKMEEAIRICGDFMLQADRSTTQVSSKEGHGNFVTYYDKKNQEYLKKAFLEALPEAVFVGEEEDVHAQIEKGYSFIVDPIDGTANFIRNRRESAISAALLKDGEVILGLVFQPYHQLMYRAILHEGATVNGMPISVSNRTIEDALIVFGTCPYDVSLADKTFDLAKALFLKGIDVRRCGSAALDLCSVAAGEAELFFEYRLQPWDYAAASLILQEAGGKITTFDGTPIDYSKSCSIFARGKGILDEDFPISSTI